jgi:uncharacterized protein YxjI
MTALFSLSYRALSAARILKEFAVHYLSKKVILSKLLAFVLAVSASLLSYGAAASCTIPSIPNQVELKEKIISLTTSFDLSGQARKLGRVSAKFFSLTDTFTYEDVSGNKIAEGKTRFFSWGVHIDVTDCEGKKIAEIKENWLKSFFKVHTVYSILDARGALVAQSEKVDWISTEFNLYDARRNNLAKIKRPWINFLSDKWTIDIYSPQAIDPRILVLIGAFKTHIDNKRRAEEDSSSK